MELSAHTLAFSPNPLLSPASPPVAAGEIAQADTRDARQAKSAAEALGTLPGPDEAVHVIISGRYSLWDCVPAILDTAGQSIDHLHIATLGFSRRNVEAMALLLDQGRIASDLVKQVFGDRCIRTKTAQIAYLTAPSPKMRQTGRVEIGNIVVDTKLGLVKMGRASGTIENVVKALKRAGAV